MAGFGAKFWVDGHFYLRCRWYVAQVIERKLSTNQEPVFVTWQKKVTMGEFGAKFWFERYPFRRYWWILSWNMAFSPFMTSFPVDDVISGLPDGAQIVVRTFFYLYIKFEAELYAYWLCRLCLSKLFIFWLFIAPIFAHPFPLLHTPFRDRKTQNWKVAGLYKGENPDGKRLIGKKPKKHAFLRAWVPQDPGGHLRVKVA